MYNIYRRALLRKITNKDKASSATSPVLQIPLKIPPQKILQIAKLRSRGVLDCKFARKFLLKLNLYHVYVYISSKSQHLENRKTDLRFRVILCCKIALEIFVQFESVPCIYILQIAKSSNSQSCDSVVPVP